MLDTPEIFRFALLAHSYDIIERFKDMVAGYRDEVHYEVVTFENGPKVARQCLNEGYEVILCHGGTGNTILRSLPHSVVLIERTDMDVLKTLRRARTFSQHVILAAYRDEFHDIPEMEKLLDIKIHHISYDTAEKLKEGVFHYHQKNVNVLVGGGVSKAYIEELGGVGFVIKPTQHNMRVALERARVIAHQQRIEKQHYKNVIHIFEHLQEGVLCVDSKQRIVIANERARRLLKLPVRCDVNCFQRFLQPLGLIDVLDDNIPRYNNVVELNGESFVATIYPLNLQPDIPCVACIFNDAPSVQKVSQKINEKLRGRGFTSKTTIDDILGNSTAAQDLKHTLRRYAATDANTLIQGETGTGKELVAQAMHVESARRDKPFVAVNISALSPELVASELFGYDEGAFTGARRGGKPGLFEMADHGTLFLDEVGDINEETQVRLLRVLESGEIMHVGGSRLLSFNVRVLSAANRPLEDLVRQGRFRLDLYFRLATLKVNVPPLRQRFEDLPLLLEALLHRYGHSAAELTQDVLAVLMRHSWPGNIRELYAIFENYLILLGNHSLDAALLQNVMRENMLDGDAANKFVPCAEVRPRQKARAAFRPDAGLSLKDNMNFARVVVAQECVASCGGDKKAAARQLGISYTTLWRILNEASASTPQNRFLE